MHRRTIKKKEKRENHGLTSELGNNGKGPAAAVHRGWVSDLVLGGPSYLWSDTEKEEGAGEGAGERRGLSLSSPRQRPSSLVAVGQW